MANHLAHIKTLMLKEVKQILSDKSVLLVAFFLPLMLVVIYGTGIRMDVKPVSVALVSSKLDDVITREVAFALAGSEYFEFTQVNNQAQAQELLLSHDIAAYIMLPNNLSQSMYHQPVEIMITINGADAQQANIARSYLEAVLLSGPTQKGPKGPKPSNHLPHHRPGHHSGPNDEPGAGPGHNPKRNSTLKPSTEHQHAQLSLQPQ